MSDFIDQTYKRVEQIIDYNNLNIKSFEDRIEVSNNSIGTAIRRKASFKSNVLNKILNSFPDINPTWLLTGKGSMILNDITREPESDYKNQKLQYQIKEHLIELLLEDNEVISVLSNQVKSIIN
ncbi:hypothetical protein SAMN04487765_1863 [Tenacibaculum sp. MAR_2010_89]|uniref:hypothetical protein n=1 Tax=Tenacibaculum sp. MAR_2010_89 TaxID=1250198 RepID=UPI0008969E9B|nr:hypothetical protein [Tenacibaculum sp. MAR_2010_89]SEE23923.1 hypothetical protein SAMN04487765_1863 [Tenacibaculum sp. MAR_2010_89]